MKDIASHWYEASGTYQPDRNGSSVVGHKWVEVRADKHIPFTILRQRNGDFVITCDQASLAAVHMGYRTCTIYAAQALAMPAEVIWSIILEGVISF
ncbi:hypothetical protein [Spirosoma sp.]|uniref:hypothetical protein n=1 Tax=Spirosoma sp. TaxID=1899569 RepID=UPI003B3A09DA